MSRSPAEPTPSLSANHRGFDIVPEEHLAGCHQIYRGKSKCRIPVIAGTGSTTRRQQLSVSGRKNTAWTTSSFLRITIKQHRRGLIVHFTAIADSIKVPVILYNIQGRTGVTLHRKRSSHLFNNVENIVAVKRLPETFPGRKIMQLTDGKIDLYSGNTIRLCRSFLAEAV